MDMWISCTELLTDECTSSVNGAGKNTNTLKLPREDNYSSVKLIGGVFLVLFFFFFENQFSLAEDLLLP